MTFARHALKTLGLLTLIIGFTVSIGACSKKSHTPGDETSQEKAAVVPEAGQDEESLARDAEGLKTTAPSDEETAKGMDSKDSEHKDEKVTNVKQAFQYTGKNIEKGSKKAGTEIKDFFVGDKDSKK